MTPDPIVQLQQAIAAQESLRATLGDAVVDATVAVLREKLAALEAQQAPTEQRKQVTILFADVSGFTALSERLDAEDVLTTMNALWARLDAAITTQGGTIDKHIGDAVMALFGAPTAHEDDPERAIRAALHMQEELARFELPAPLGRGPAGEDLPRLRMRIGINTGPVLLGAVGTTTEYTAMGDAVNVASRLEHAAPIEGILISHDTYRHVVGVFEVDTLEPIAVKGKTEPIQVYLVRGVRQRAFRVTTRGVEGLEIAMVGRTAELHRLQAALPAVVARRMPHLVTLVGEAGVGKSRLVYEYGRWLEHLPPPLPVVFRGRTDPQRSTLPYALIRALLANHFAIRDSDSAPLARAKLEQGLVALAGPEGREKAHFLGHLIGFDFSASSYLRGILGDARQIRDRAFYYAVQLFAAVAAAPPGPRPVVLFLDDIHWADAGSLDLIEHLLHEGQGIPLLIVCLARDTLFERRPDWGRPPEQHTRLVLQPLTPAESARLVAEILRKIPTIPPRLLDLIVGSAEGNPFYVEELIKKLIEDRVIVKGADAWEVAADRLADLQVPSTLTSLLQARLDALPAEEHTTLQRAAVVGRIFWESAVACLETDAQAPPSAIEERLHSLQSKELLFDRDPSAFAEEQEFMFKHALLHDVTYESVLRRLRRVYHGRVAEWLLAHGGERVAEYAGLIGRHYELAEQSLEAAHWYGRAGKQAQDTYAPGAAIDYYQKALAFLPDEAAYAGQRVPLYEGLAEVLRLEARFAEADPAFQAMRATAEAAGDGAAQARAWLGLARSQDNQSEHRAALESATRAEEVAQAAGAPVELASALFMRGWEQYRVGNAAAALELGEQALTLSTAHGARSEMSLSLNLLGAAHDTLGHPEQALRYTEQALALDREMGSLRDAAITLNNLGMSACSRGDYEAAVPLFEEALDTAQKIGYRWGAMSYRSALGGARVGLGEYPAAVALLREVIRMPEAGRWVGLSAAYRFLAEAYLGAGQTGEALGAAQRALELAQEAAQQENSGLAWRVLGLVAAYQPHPVMIGAQFYSAPACFGESLHIFTAMGAEGERARTLRAWAWYERARGDAHGDRLWEEARVLFTRLGMALEVARMDTADPAYLPLAG